MIEIPTVPIILASRTILSRFLRVFVSMTIEARILRDGMYLSPKKSVEYATVINLFAEIFAWFTFFFLESVLPEASNNRLIRYLLLQKVDGVDGTVFIITVWYFLLFLVLKWSGLEIYRLITASQKVQESTSKDPNDHWSYRLKMVIRAHTVSYIVGLVIMILHLTEWN